MTDPTRRFCGLGNAVQSSHDGQVPGDPNVIQRRLINKLQQIIY
ncbi:hypothetical protein [Accumulibacter sp.]|nr:hypothetical protein [Accumulibacter sp.]